MNIEDEVTPQQVIFSLRNPYEADYHLLLDLAVALQKLTRDQLLFISYYAFGWSPSEIVEKLSLTGKISATTRLQKIVNKLVLLMNGEIDVYPVSKRVIPREKMNGTNRVDRQATVGQNNTSQGSCETGVHAS